MYTFEQTKEGYANLWDKAKIKPEHNAEAMKWAKRALDNEAVFRQVENATGVPWYMIAVILFRESGMDLNTYLGNGQSLHRVTTVVPAGRGPFSTFTEGAIDAIRLEGMYHIGPWTLELILYWLERFNGQGYFGHGNSPYLWSWTDQYRAGKFVADHVYDANFVDPQGGCVAVLKALFEIDPTLMPPRIAQEKKMPDTTVTTVPAPHFDLHQVTSTINSIIGFLPAAAAFFPPLKPIVPFIPLIKGALEMAAELQDKGHDPQAIVDVIVKHLGDIKAQVEALHAQVQAQVQGGSTTTGG